MSTQKCSTVLDRYHLAVREILKYKNVNNFRDFASVVIEYPALSEDQKGILLLIALKIYFTSVRSNAIFKISKEELNDLKPLIDSISIEQYNDSAVLNKLTDFVAKYYKLNSETLEEAVDRITRLITPMTPVLPISLQKSLIYYLQLLYETNTETFSNYYERLKEKAPVELLNSINDSLNFYKLIELNKIEGVDTLESDKIFYVITKDFRELYVIEELGQYRVLDYNSDTVTTTNEVLQSKDILHKTYARYDSSSTEETKDVAIEQLNISGLSLNRKLRRRGVNVEKVYLVRVDNSQTKARQEYIKTKTNNARTAETFETAEQQRSLITKGNRILTVARQTDEYILMVKFTDGTVAPIYQPNNFVVIDSDNNVEKLNLDDQNHFIFLNQKGTVRISEKALGQQESKLKSAHTVTKFRKINRVDITRLRNNIKAYNELVAEHSEGLQKGQFKDITEFFFTKYSAKKVTEKAFYNLSLILESIKENKTDELLPIPVYAQRQNPDGTVVYELVYSNLPLIVRKINDQKVEIISELKDYYIKDENTGRFVKISEQALSAQIEKFLSVNGAFYKYLSTNTLILIGLDENKQIRSKGIIVSTSVSPDIVNLKRLLTAEGQQTKHISFANLLTKRNQNYGQFLAAFSDKAIFFNFNANQVEEKYKNLEKILTFSIPKAEFNAVVKMLLENKEKTFYGILDKIISGRSNEITSAEKTEFVRLKTLLEDGLALYFGNKLSAIIEKNSNNPLLQEFINDLKQNSEFLDNNEKVNYSYFFARKAHPELGFTLTILHSNAAEALQIMFSDYYLMESVSKASIHFELNENSAPSVVSVESQPEVLTKSDEDAIDIDESFLETSSEAEVVIATEEQIKEEDAWIRRTLGDVEVKYESNFKINDKIVLGRVYRGVIYLNKELRGEGTLYHEAFHYVFNYMFADETKQRLIDAILNDPKYKKEFTAQSLAEFAIERNYQNKSFEEVLRLKAEEILADKFKQFALKEQKKAPQTLIQRFFNFLKDIIDTILGKKSYIEKTFKNIYTGKIKAVNKENITELIDETERYELIPTVKEFYKDHKGVVKSRIVYLTLNDQRNLVNTVVAKILNDTTNDSFDEKFDKACESLLQDEWSWNTIFAINNALNDKEKQKDIESKLKKTIRGIHYLLTEDLNENPIFNINSTDENSYERVKVQDNIEAREAFKELVRVEYEKSKLIEDLYIDTADKQINEEDGTVVEREENIEGEDAIAKDKRFDQNLTEFDINKLNAGYIRRLLSTITYISINKVTGIKTWKTADSNLIFRLLVQITTNSESHELIDKISQYSIILEQDGYIEEATVLKEVVKILNSHDKDSYLIKLFKNVFESVELPYMFIEVTKSKSMDEQDWRYNTYDKIRKTDIANKKLQLLAEMKDKISTLRSLNTERLLDIWKLFNTDYALDATVIEKENLEEDIKNIKDFFDEIGLKFSYSLITTSYYMLLKNNYSEVYEKFKDEIDTHLSLFDEHIAEENYITPRFINDLMKFLFGKSDLTKVNLDNSIEMMNNAVSRLSLEKGKINYSTLGRSLNYQMNKIMNFVLSSDPTYRPSIVYNAEGKPIYRYVKPNPLSILLNKVRKYGLEKVLEQDEFWNITGKEYFADEPINNQKVISSKQKAILIRNLRNVFFGGTQQNLDYSKFRPAKNFDSLDEKSRLILSISLFFNQQRVRQGNDEIITYFRQYHQLEVLSTNYLVTSIYMRGLRSTSAIMHELFISKLKQEYNRIKREYQDRTNPDKTRIKDYNVRINYVYDAETDKISIIRDTEDSSLKAYNFVNMKDFLSRFPQLEEMLLQAAREGKDFEETLNSPLNEVSLKQNLEKAITDFLNSEYALFEQLLINNKIIDENYNSNILPKTIKIDGEVVYTIGNVTNVSANQLSMKDALIAFFFNNYYNTMLVNGIFDGDFAMNVKNKIDLVKRYKKLGAAGSTMKSGRHRVAFLNTVTQFISAKDKTKGPYVSLSDILNDPLIEDANERLEVVEEFNKATAEINNTGKLPSSFRKVFDGQSISNIMHVIDILENLGRVPDVRLNDVHLIDILIAKAYRSLTEEEIEFINKFQISFNSKKTVTSSQNLYLKLSEMTLDRTDVSLLFNPKENRVATADERQELYNELHALYKRVYELRKEYQALQEDEEMQIEYETVSDPDDESQQPRTLETIEEELKDLYVQIHQYFVPYPGRELRHKLLNSMEYHLIDQIVDTEASKNATLTGFDILFEDTIEDYFPLNNHSLSVRNETKYLQVETATIHHYVKYPLQVMNMAANDLTFLAETLLNEVLTAEEKTHLHDLAQEFNRTLNEIFKAKKAYFEKYILKEGKLDLAELYATIREGLEHQGANEHFIKMFSYTEEDVPMMDVNMPLIQKTLMYYIFSLINRNILDNKMPGKKYIHESIFGNKVIYNIETGEVINKLELLKNPQKYLNPNGSLRPSYSTRELGVIKIQEGNVTKYVIEVFITDKNFSNETELEFFLSEAWQSVGARVPTEGFRSIAALKPVDFLDSSKQNAIAVPYVVHILAGSDFDVDSLYTMEIKYYKWLNNKYYVYDGTRKYQEAFMYFSSIPQVSQIKRELLNKLSDLETRLNELRTLNTDAAKQEYEVLRKQYVDILTNDNVLDFIENMIKLDPGNIIWSDLYNIAMTIKVDETITFLGLKDVVKNINEKLKDDVDLMGMEKRFLRDEKNQAKESISAILALIQVAASVNAMQSFNPNFINEIYNASKSITVFAAQNLNIKALFNIISNEHVFKHLTINKQSSTENINRAIKFFNETFSIDNFVMNTYAYSPTYVITSFTVNMGGIEGLGVAAALKRFFSVANTYNLSLAFPVWDFLVYDKDGKVVNLIFSSFSGNLYAIDGEQFVLSDVTTTDISGEVIGMFADSAKEPLHNVMRLNTINIPIFFTMLNLRLPFEFCLGFNYNKDIASAISLILESSSALTENFDFRYQLLDEILYEKLKQYKPSEEYMKLVMEYQGNIDDHVLVYMQKPEPGQITVEGIMNNQYDFYDLGYRLKIKNPETNEFEEADRNTVNYHYLALYIDQVNDMSIINKGNDATGRLFKNLKSDLSWFRNYVKNIEEFHSSKKIHNLAALQNSAYKTMARTMLHLDRLLRETFDFYSAKLEKLSNLFSSYYSTFDNFAERVSAFLILKTFLNNYKIDSEIKLDSIANLQMKELYRLIGFSASVLSSYDKAFKEKLEQMKMLLPDNAFVQSLIIRETGRQIKLNGELINEYYVTIDDIRKIISPEHSAVLRENVIEMFTHQNVAVRFFINELFYKELFRTGLQTNVKNSILQLFIEHLAEISNLYANSNKELLDSLDSNSQLGKSNFEALFIALLTNVSVNKVPKVFISRAYLETLNNQLSKVEPKEIEKLKNNIQLKDKQGKELIVAKSTPIDIMRTLASSKTHTIEFNFRNFKSISKLLSDIKYQLGITLTISEDEAESFNFPLLININNRIYMLSQIDDTNTLDKAYELNEDSERENINFAGNKAVYTDITKLLEVFKEENRQSFNFVHLTKDELYNLVKLNDKFNQEEIVEITEEQVEEVLGPFLNSYLNPLTVKIIVPNAMTDKINAVLMISDKFSNKNYLIVRKMTPLIEEIKQKYKLNRLDNRMLEYLNVATVLTQALPEFIKHINIQTERNLKSYGLYKIMYDEIVLPAIKSFLERGGSISFTRKETTNQEKLFLNPDLYDQNRLAAVKDVVFNDFKNYFKESMNRFVYSEEDAVSIYSTDEHTYYLSENTGLVSKKDKEGNVSLVTDEAELTDVYLKIADEQQVPISETLDNGEEIIIIFNARINKTNKKFINFVAEGAYEMRQTEDKNTTVSLKKYYENLDIDSIKKNLEKIKC